MKLNDYLKKNKMTKTDFAKSLGMSRVTINYYIKNPEKTTLLAKIAIEYITVGEVTRNDWN
jgi:predicted transcriptional regulator